MKKFTVFALITIILISAVSVTVCADDTVVPYTNFTYSEADGSVVECPQAYIPEEVVYGTDLGVGAFLYPTDFDTDSNGDIYILDAGNGRVVSVDTELNFKSQFDCIVNGEKIDIATAQGITVTSDKIYICDTDKRRILVFGKTDGIFEYEIGTPTAVALDENFLFKPSRVAVDEKGDLYVVSSGTYEGILNLKADGEFVNFFAANKVSTDAWDLFWRNFATKTQRKAMLRLIPQDFSSIDLDAQGFLLITTFTAVDNSMVKRANPGGTDVIRSLSNKYIAGNGSDSSFSDITSGPDKIYSCLDRKNGKIYTYNNDGYLLYTFGSKSSQQGGFKNPVAVTYLDDYRIAVLDTDRASFTVFNTTEYSDTIHRANKYQNELEYDKAAEEWENVLGYNSNFSLAIKMIGIRCFEAGEYKLAKKYFKQCNAKELYSDARQELRSNWIYNNSWIIMIIVIGIGIFYLFVKIKESVKKKKAREFAKQQSKSR